MTEELAKSTLIVDAHAHIFKEDLPLRDNPRHAPTYDFTIEDYEKQLNANGVDYAVLAAASPWADYNDYLIDSIRGKDRFRGTVILEPSVERYVLQHMAQDGVVGVRMHMIGLEQLPDISTFEYRRMFRRIADLGWHVHLHCEGRDLPELLPHFERAGMNLVVDHLGRPDPEEGINSDGFKALLQVMENGRTWAKASGHHRLGKPAVGYLQELIRQTGNTRLIWGSDCPFVGQEDEATYASTMNWFLDAVPDADDRIQILGKNARALYFSD